MIVPLFARALFLEQISGKYLLVGLVRQYPLSLTSDDELRIVASKYHSLVLTLSHDRAAAHYVVLSALYHRFDSPGLPTNIYLHAEACALHDLHLVRHRPSVGRDIIGSMCSFTRFVRTWRAADAFRRELILFVEKTLVISHGGAPLTRYPTLNVS